MCYNYVIKNKETKPTMILQINDLMQLISASFLGMIGRLPIFQEGHFIWIISLAKRS